MPMNSPAYRKPHIHFIGIGGISMSGIAHILLKRGYMVTGSDTCCSKITEKLVKQGAVVYKGHRKEHVMHPDLVVYTSAIDTNNPELEAAREKGIKIVDRATILGDIMKEFKYSIAVAGAHGKTTATSIISLMLCAAGVDPTLLIGGELDEIGGNVRLGNGPYFVTEACEYKENFLKFYPYISVILNIDAEHLDFFKDMQHIKSAYTRFARLVPDHGWTVLYKEDPNVAQIQENIHCNILTYGLKPDADISAGNIKFNVNGGTSFDLMNKGVNCGRITLNIPGKHNILNALAACAVCSILDVEFSRMKDVLESFSGTHRRFEKKGVFKGAVLIDDYAHHPTEIKATMEAAVRYPHNKIWCVFQPHTYSRTKLLLDDFSESFDAADRIIVTDIYAAREKDTGEVHSSDLVKKIQQKGKNAVYISDFTDITVYLTNNLKEGDLILTVGAGNVYRIGEMLLEGAF